MIKPSSITHEWICKVAKENKADRILVEKAIRALALLEGLANTSLPFIFKGGTALMLMFQKPHRLSIDIDIIVSPRDNDIDSVLHAICGSDRFTRFECQQRASTGGIPAKHYKFYYHSAVEDKEASVLLDVLFEENPYNVLVDLPVANASIDTETPDVMVKVPDFNNLLADKMTAFAPRTIGVPYTKGNNSFGMEIIKQLYDIGRLFDKADDMFAINSTYRRIAEKELLYHNISCTVDDVLSDTMDNALSICFRCSHKGTDFETLLLGIKQVTNHIFSESFHIEKAILFAAKTYYLAASLMTHAPKIEKYAPSHNAEIAQWTISEYEYTKLNKLKKTNPEAFFYLYKGLLMMLK